MTARDDRILGHVRCLAEGPHFGVSLLLIERQGRIGFVPTAGHETLFEEFYVVAQFKEACAAAADAASAAPPPRAFPCSSST